MKEAAKTKRTTKASGSGDDGVKKKATKALKKLSNSASSSGVPISYKEKKIADDGKPRKIAVAKMAHCTSGRKGFPPSTMSSFQKKK